MFTLLHFFRKSECELSGHQKPDRQNPSRMYDQALRDIPNECVDLQSIRLAPVVEFRLIDRRSFQPKTKV